MIWTWWLTIAAALLLVVGVIIGIIISFKGVDSEGPCFLAGGMIGLGSILTAVGLVASGCCEYNRIHQPLYWEEFSTMCQQVIDSGNVITNRDLASKVIEYNTWLAEARANQRTLGKWSLWHDVDLSKFIYIDLGNGTEFDITFGNSGE